MAAKTEQRTFTMHPGLLFDVIRRQAGTLDQAIREGVMNAVDARANKVTLSINKTEMILTDNGTGFKDREQIKTCFEVFGQPHEAGEKKIFGAFRMGRGQLFAYGRNTWTTGKFVMKVDIANMGLDYDLEEVQAFTPGCTVKVAFYKPLNSYDIEQLVMSLRRSLKWVATEIYVNGNEESISMNPATRPEGYWTYENDDAYIRLTENDQTYNSIDIYNMGVFVSANTGRWAHNAVVVSKKALTLNFARNEVMQGCPIWSKVKSLVEVERKAKTSKPGKKKSGPSKTLKPKERDELARQLIEKELKPNENRHLRLIQDMDGKHWSANMLADVIKDYRSLITVAAPSEKSKKIRANHMAFPLSVETRKRFLAKDASELAETLKKLWPGMLNIKGEDFDDLWSESYDQVQLIDEDKLTPLERAVAQTLQVCMSSLVGQTRKIRFGVTYGPEHWTDGFSYIGLDREWLKRNNVDVVGWFSLARVVQHELLHKTSSLNKKHKHDADFYEQFYDCYPLVVDFAIECFNRFPEFASKCGVSAEEVNLKAAAQEAELLNSTNEFAKDLLLGVGEETDDPESISPSEGEALATQEADDTAAA